MIKIETIEKEFGNHLFNFIKSKVNVLPDAQDIYQEVLETIIQKIDAVEKPESIKSWVFSIARNKIVDHFRLHQKKSEQDIDNMFSKIALSSQQSDPYQSIEGCIIPLINQLPDAYRELIHASEIEEKSQKELAEKYNINYVTLRSKVQRGRKQLKKILYDNCTIQTNTNGSLTDCTPVDVDNCCDGKSGCENNI